MKRILLLLFLISTLFGLNLIRVSSNFQYLLDNESDLLIQNKSGSGSLATSKTLLSDTLYSDEYVVIQSLLFSRSNASWFDKNILSKLLPQEITIFEFNRKNEFKLTADTENNLKPINSQGALELSSANFSLNTSFYNKGVINELILEGKRYNKASRSASGFLRIIDGFPYAGTKKTVFNKINGKIEYSCQAHPSVIGNGEIWNYIKSEQAPYKSSWKSKTYRNLIGTTKSGNLVCVLSNRRGLISVKEIALIGDLYGLEHATLFDGGSALQYQWTSEEFQCKFSAINNNFSFGDKIDELSMKKAHGHFPSASPVFLTVKRK